MKLLMFIFITTFMLFSCDDKHGGEENTPTYNAKVLRIGADCGDTFLIRFNNGITNVPANSTNNIFYAINLPASCKIENLEINVRFRMPNSDEIMNCTAKDVAYPQIYIEGVN